MEMIILLHLDPADARAMRAYRLQVKERLYRFNYASSSIVIQPFVMTDRNGLQEVLVQLEDKERLEKLQETFESVREDYQRILAMVH